MNRKDKERFFIVSYQAEKGGSSITGSLTYKYEIYPNRTQIMIDIGNVIGCQSEKVAILNIIPLTDEEAKRWNS